MITFILTQWKYIAIAALVAVIGVQGMRIEHAHTETAKLGSEFADYRATQAESARLAERSRRETEQRWAQAVEGVANEGQKRIDVARADAVRAGAAEQRLQLRVSAFLSAIRGAAADSGIATAGAPADDPAILLADLFGRARARARLLGEFADQAHAAGKTCEAYGDRLQPAAR